MLHGRASMRPGDVAFTFTDYLDDPSGVRESLTWAQLSRRTMNVARELSLHGSAGSTAVIPVSYTHLTLPTICSV